jgi:hypothetical protein
VFDNANAPAVDPGIFSVGTVTTDSFGKSLSDFGTLSFSQTGNDIYLNFTYAPPVPEPSTWVGIAALAFVGTATAVRMALSSRDRQNSSKFSEGDVPLAESLAGGSVRFIKPRASDGQKRANPTAGS